MVVNKSKLIRISEGVWKRLDELRTRPGKKYSYDTILHLMILEYEKKQ